MSTQERQRANQRLALINGKVVLPHRVASGLAVVINGPIIAAVVDAETLGDDIERFDVGGRLITPGLIDIHTHGALGHTFNEPTAEAFDASRRKTSARGVPRCWLPRRLHRFPIWWPVWNSPGMDGRSAAGAQVLGVHLEGPYSPWPRPGPRTRSTSAIPTTARPSFC